MDQGFSPENVNKKKLSKLMFMDKYFLNVEDVRGRA